MSCYEIMKTDSTHLQNLRKIVLLQEKLYVLGATLDIRAYDYEETIQYFYDMFAYCDARRIICFAVGRLTAHVELLKLLLKPLLNYLEDEPLLHVGQQAVQSMEKFLAEYTFDVSRHAIGHIGVQNESFLFEGNAYHFRESTSAHVFCQFAQYILRALQEYLSMKCACKALFDVVVECQGDDRVQAPELVKEIEAFQTLVNSLDLAIEVVEDVLQHDADGEAHQARLQQQLGHVDTQTRALLHGLVHNAPSS